MVNPNIKIVVCGTLKSQFIVDDIKLLSKYYNINVINLDVVQEKREGFIFFLWSLLTKDIFTLYKSDIIYIWFSNYPAVPLIILSKLFGKKSIITVGGGEVADCPEINYGDQCISKFRGAAARWCLKYADIVIIPSYSYKNIIKNLAPVSNVCVIPHAIDTSLCEFPLPVKSDKIITATMTLKFNRFLKGIHIFEAAAEKVPYECIVYEAIDHDSLINELRMAKVYCQLSYTESFGVTNVEAMACGCVPIVTDRDALPEIIGNTGLVVPYGDVDATVKAMHKAITMNGNAARERAKLYSVERRMKLLSKVIENDYVDILGM